MEYDTNEKHFSQKLLERRRKITFLFVKNFIPNEFLIQLKELLIWENVNNSK